MPPATSAPVASAPADTFLSDSLLKELEELEAPKFAVGAAGASAPPVAQRAPLQSPMRLPALSGKIAAAGMLSDSEIAVLRESSFVNGKLFQPWLDGEEEREIFRYDHAYCDPDGLLPLSQHQKEAGAVWLRPKDFVVMNLLASGAIKPADVPPPPASPAPQTSAASPSASASASSSASGPQTASTAADTAASSPTPVSPVAGVPANIRPIMIETMSPLKITQDLVSDCSFVCSLCITAAFEQKFKRQLISRIIYPQNARGQPIYNPFGKYLVKLHVNGVLRKVVVDDRLPAEPNSGRLLCSSTTDPRELWVSIIEKAYMKVNGGYDFPGSNSGIDLHALTGWIPEQIFFAEDKPSQSSSSSGKSGGGGGGALDHRQSEDRAWERLVSAHKFGDCLVTIATGEALTAEE